ncbi:histidine kinase [Cohnella sp.]|uniref:sensor histidine kinase n=1 Tax=Cohnella sp. TaxID=1883426 RepID=UPI003564ABE3
MKTRLGKLFDSFRFQRIRSRVLLGMIVISVPALFLLGYVSFNTAKDTLMETNTRTNQDHLKTSSEVAELLFQNIENLNQAIVFDEGTRDELRLSNQISDRGLYDLPQKIRSRMQRVMNNNFIDSSYVDSVCLLNLNMEAYCLGRSDDAGKYEGSDKLAVIPSEEWYRTASDAQGRVVFLGSNVLENNPNSFSSVKLFRDAVNLEGKPIGMLIVNISSSIFDRIFIGAKSYGGTYLAIDSSVTPVRIIYPGQSELTPTLEQGDLTSIFAQLENQGYLNSKYVNETTEWTFLHAIKANMLLRQSNQIGVFTATIAFLIALGAILLSYFISGGITRPLLKLKKMMVDWTKGAREFDEISGKDEVSVIGSTFRRMAFENDELNHRLIESKLKEREAELRVLQAQINPHFLYNTLDSIYWMAMLQKHKNIAQMAISLSKSFKLSLNNGRETILVYKEFMHIEHYLTIQNIRYNERFTFHQNVDDSIMRIEMLKLLLQPLVENAITHGLEPQIGEGTVSLTGKRDGEFLVFVVEDDGVGMEDLSVIEKGFGMRNVKERLTLYYGPSSSFDIMSEKGKGTKVTLRFRPYEKEWQPDAESRVI